MEFNTQIQLRYIDFDMMGHVNSAAYFTFMETARVQVMWELWRDQPFEAVVARQGCDYKKPIFWGDGLTVTTKVAKVGTTSFELHYRLHDGKGKTYAEASSIMVCFDKESQSPVQVPDSVRALLSP